MKTQGEQLWIQLEQVHQQFKQLVGELKSCDRTTRLNLIKQGYKNRALTVDVLEYIVPDELKELLPFLLSHARSVHPYLGRVRQIILSLPKKWLVEHIDGAAEPLLQNGDDEEYRRLLELYTQIDLELTKRLALRALTSSDPNVREVGQDFIEKLGS